MNDSTLRTTVTSLFAKTHDRLKRYGAAEVLLDEGDLRTALERRRFFARPKLALDCIGGAAAARVAHALSRGRGVSPAPHWARRCVVRVL